MPRRDDITVTGRLTPFQADADVWQMPVGLSVSGILDSVIPEAATGHARVWLNDRLLSPEEYDIIPRPNDILVFRAVPAGGGGKDIMRIVSMVAVMAFATLAGESLAWEILGEIPGLSDAAFAFGQALFTGTIFMLGSAAIGSLFPLPTQALPQLGGTKNDSSATYSINGFQNQLRPWGVIPRVFGRHRMAPYYAAKPYTELVGNDQYIRVLLCWGYGPLHVIDLRLGDTPLSNFTGVEIDHRTGRPGEPQISLYPTQVKEENLSIRIREGSAEGWTDYDIDGASFSYIYDAQPVSTTSLLLATADGLQLYDSTAAEGEQVTTVLELDYPLKHVTKAPDNSLYAWSPRNGNGRLYRSTDDGVTWTQCGGDFSCYNVAVGLPGFVAHGADLYLFLVESVNNVATLAMYSVASTGITRVSTVTSGFLFPYTPVIHCASSGAALWVAVGNDLLTSSDSGVTWTTAVTTYDTEFRAVYADSGVVLVGTIDGSVYRSTDAGSTFSVVSVASQQIQTIYKSAAGVLYSGTTDGDIYSSADDGATWALHGDAGDKQPVYLIDEFNSELILVAGQVDVWRVMRHDTVANVRTTAADTDEIVAVVTFQGLGKFGAAGKITEETVDFVVEYALTGTTNWSIGETGVVSAATMLAVDDAPEAGVSKYDSEVESRRGIRIDLVVVDKSSGEVRIRSGVPGFNSTGTVAQIRASFAKNGEVGGEVAEGLWGHRPVTITAPEPAGNEMALAKVLSITDLTYTTAVDSDGLMTTTWSSTQLNIEAGDVYDVRNPDYLVDPADFAVTADGTSRSVSVAAGTVTSVFRVTAASSSAVRYGARLKVTRGQYDVRVRRLTPDSTSETVMDKMYWSGLQSITYDNPVNMTGLCLTAVRIKATEQLSGTIDNLNGIVHSILPDWDTASGTWVERITSNPASHLRHILTNAAENRDALSVLNGDLYDLDFEGLYEYCQARGIECNMVIDYDASVDEVFARVAAVARATKTLRGGYKTGVLIDREQTVERQAITPRNAWGFKWSKAFADQPHALRVRFVNEDKNWTHDELIVYADGYDSASATKYDSLELMGITNHRQAYREARYHMAVAKLRPETWTVTMDFEALAVTRGSLVRFAYDVPKIGIVSTRIKQVVDDGVYITAFVLDEEAVMETGKSYCLRVRHDDLSMSYHPLVTVAGSSNTVTLTTPVALGSGPQAGDLCLYGEVGTESVQALVKAVDPGHDLTATLTLVPYSPKIYLADKVAAVDVTTGVLPDTDTIRLDNHGFTVGDPVTLGTSDTMPGGLSTGTTYYVINAVSDSFQLATTAGGTAVDITTTGAGYLYVTYTIPEYVPVIAEYPGSETPVVESIVSDETVMVRRPDGTLSPRVKIVLANVGARDLGEIEAIVVTARKIPAPVTSEGRLTQ